MLIVAISTSWAEDITIFSWTAPSSGTAVTSLTNDYGTIAAKNGSSTGDANIIYSSNNYYTIRLNGKNDFSTQYIEVTLKEGVKLKTGDKLVVAGFTNSSGKSDATRFQFGSTNVDYSTDDFAQLGGNGGNTSAEVQKVLGTEANDVTTFKITRLNGKTNFFITTLKILRTKTCTDVAAPTNLACSAQTSSSLTFTWTAAENASKYTATIYSDSECTQEVISTANITTNTVTFTSLSGSSAYYCKVQSNGDGTTYCDEGGITAAVSGTTSAKAYTVTATSNNNEWGTADAEASSLDASETTEVTATANEGYKFSSWSVEGEGAQLSSTTTNPTTLTMGTANATVTATFRALETYTISYAPGTGTSEISGSKADESKTEDAAFTLPSTAIFTQSGYLQTGWALTDGGAQAYALGGGYETNADQTFYPVWTAAYELSFNANGGSGSMEGMIGSGEVKLPENLYTKSGYTFMGWATSPEAATAGTVAYADLASYTISSDATLYAVWTVSSYSFTPKAVTEAESLNVNDVVISSIGGTMTVANRKGASSVQYTTNGLALSGGGKDSLHVKLDSYMKPGTVIIVKLVAGSNTTPRGLNLRNNTPSTVTMLGWANTTTVATDEVGVFSYTVTATDGLSGTRDFILARNNTVYIKSINVVNCGEPAIVELNNVDGFNYGFAAFCAPSNFTVEGGTAYKAVVNGGKIVLKDLSGIIPANAGVVIAGTKGADATITYTTDEAPADMTGNNLHGTTTRTLTSVLKGSSDKFMALQKSTSKFKPYTGTYFPAYKAYILLDSTNAPESLEMVFDEATAITNVNANDNANSAAPAKVIKNGKLYIGNYNVAGQLVK